MTQTLPEPYIANPGPSPTRRRELPSAPVLIRVPIVAATRVSRPDVPRRRRLRREVRAAGYLLLVAVPAGLASIGLGGFRPPSVEASPLGSTVRAEVVEVPEGPAPAISLSLEPVPAANPAREAAEVPVVLSGQLLPVDPHEEPSHGGH